MDAVQTEQIKRQAELADLQNRRCCTSTAKQCTSLSYHALIKKKLVEQRILELTKQKTVEQKSMPSQKQRRLRSLKRLKARYQRIRIQKIELQKKIKSACFRSDGTPTDPSGSTRAKIKRWNQKIEELDLKLIKIKDVYQQMKPDFDLEPSQKSN